MTMKTNGKWINTVLADTDKYDVKLVKVCVYCEKDKNANPYYVSNAGLCKCSRAVLEIFNCYRDDTSADENYEDLDYLMTNNVFKLENISGGHRNTMVNDTEIKFSALLRPHTSTEDFLETVREICGRHQVCCSFCR